MTQPVPSNTCLTTIAIICLVSLTSPVLSIKCWVCHSDTDPKCADPFDNSTLPIKDCREVKYEHLTIADPYELDQFNFQKQFPSLYRPVDKPRPLRLREATMCRKIRQKIHGNWRTIRSCAFLGKPGEGTGNEHNCLYRQGTHDIYLEYCTCDSKDGCNTGPLVNIPRMSTMLALIATSLIISIIY